MSLEEASEDSEEAVPRALVLASNIALHSSIGLSVDWNIHFANTIWDVRLSADHLWLAMSPCRVSKASFHSTTYIPL